MTIWCSLDHVLVSFISVWKRYGPLHIGVIRNKIARFPCGKWSWIFYFIFFSYHWWYNSDFITAVTVFAHDAKMNRSDELMCLKWIWFLVVFTVIGYLNSLVMLWFLWVIWVLYIFLRCSLSVSDWRSWLWFSLYLNSNDCTRNVV